MYLRVRVYTTIWIQNNNATLLQYNNINDYLI